MAVDPAALAAKQAAEAAAASATTGAQDPAAGATTTPATTGAQDPAAGATTTPAATETKPRLLSDLEVTVKDKAPEVYDHILELRSEAKTHRLEKQELMRQKAEVEAKLAEIEAAKKEAERKELEQRGEFQKLWEQEKAEKAELLRNAQTKLIETAIEKEALSKGVPPQLIKLITKHGVHVDESGQVKGIDNALSRFEEQHADLLEVVKAAEQAKRGGGATTAAATTAQQPPSMADQIRVPGTNMTYKEYQDMASGKANVANAGATPAPTTPTANQKPDLRKVPKKDADEWYKNFRAGLSNK